MLTWIRGFQIKIAIFLSFFCRSIPKRDLKTKKTQPNIEVCPESLGVMLEYKYIERGLLIDITSDVRNVYTFTIALVKKENAGKH